MALELSALAFLGYVVMGDDQRTQLLRHPCLPGPEPVLSNVEGTPQGGTNTAATPPSEKPVAETPAEVASPHHDDVEPLEFIKEPADDGARYYRAADDSVIIIAGFYSDGRVRLADAQAHRFAGMLEGGRADIIDLRNNQWSELLVHVTPSGTMQLELRGGPHDAHVLTCDTLTL
jgi:hypothetical protein